MPEEFITEELKKQMGKFKVPNIAVIGRTGVGKSTIINSVFGANLAPTGTGLSITPKFHRYPPKKSQIPAPVVIYDSPGFQAGKEEKFVKTVSDFLAEKQKKAIKEQKQQEGFNSQIHLVWYIVNAASARVEPFEKEIIDKINSQKIPAIIVLSQCDRASDNEIEGVEKALRDFELAKVYDILQIAASPLILPKTNKPICEPFGLNELLDKTIELLPDIYTEALIAMQMVNLKDKREIVWKYISTAAMTCFGAGFTPVPNSATLLTSQISLCIGIASIYGYKEVTEFIVNIGTVATLNTLISTALGDVFGLFFPPGSVLTAAASASYIVAFGRTCTAVFEKMAKDNLQGKGKEEIKQYLQANFQQEFAKYTLFRINSPEELKIVEHNFLNPS
ncbi:MAG: 50S ribosome-binding GTPase [Nostoc sp. NMS1]|uniref:GTPase family protein n=1 Tax=unclassified Nostoc TaxID=2593658 RepID=UPI0025FBE8F7|nr:MULTISPECIES: GTPase [unclassified Nostoc]MBN3905197.1 50S ribosome-binding GTPase [Nostoc sp. NMS1]MBN3992692.1 50S ribosome-binding GTPase [Nostoc sp. NMS2]